MQGEIPIGDKRIPYEFVEKRGIRNTYLRFYGEKLVIVAPKRVFRPQRPEPIIEKYKSWIIKHHSQVKDRIQFFQQNYTTYLGKRYLTVFAEGQRSIEVNRDAIIVRAENREAADKLLERMIRTETQNLLPKMVEGKAAQLGQTVKEVNFRRGRRWGSCSSSRKITFHPYLSSLPIELIDYIASHEAAHLKEMNHSLAFWEVVSKVCPDYKLRRKALRNYDNDPGRVMS